MTVVDMHVATYEMRKKTALPLLLGKKTASDSEEEATANSQRKRTASDSEEEATGNSQRQRTASDNEQRATANSE